MTRKTVTRPRPRSLAEQEASFARALDPGRATARDLVAAETARIEAACATLPPDARAWVNAGLTLPERSRRLGEALAEVGDTGFAPAAVVAKPVKPSRKRPRTKPVKVARKQPARAVAPIEFVWVSADRLAALMTAAEIAERLAGVAPSVVTEPIDVDDVPHLERITASRRATPLVEKHAARRGRKETDR